MISNIFHCVKKKTPLRYNTTLHTSYIRQLLDKLDSYKSSVLFKVMQQSKNAIIKHCFPSTEPDTKRRPETVRNDSDDDAQ